MEKMKATCIAVMSAIFSCLGILAIPVMILLGCNLMDYYTGINAAKFRAPGDARPIKSYKSIKGINKKVSMYLLILLGWFVDVMIEQALGQLVSITIPPVFATVIACWLVFNEIISILENMDDMGAGIPPIFAALDEKD